MNDENESTNDNEKARFDRVWKVIKENEAELRYPGVLNIRPGYKMKNGWFTKDEEPAIVFEVNQKLDESDLSESQIIPKEFKGIPTDVVPASPEKRRVTEAADDAGSGDDFSAERRTTDPDDDLALPGWDVESGDSAELDSDATEEDTGLIPYKTPTDVRLEEITGAGTVVCHVSPDAGWKTLKKFFSDVESSLTVGMYDFTAPHIVEGINAAVSGVPRKFSLVLDPGESLGDGTKANDTPEADVIRGFGNNIKHRFSFAWAAVGHKKVSGAIYPSAYHIKVAVKDSDSFWLSSGNWQSSNQPDIENLTLSKRKILRSYNREWHVVLSNPELAAIYEGFLNWDMKQARPLQIESDAVEVSPEAPAPQLLIPRSVMDELESDISETKFFEAGEFTFDEQNPLRVMPLLTPDNYAPEVLKVIESAQRTLYFQNQSLKINKKPPTRYKRLLDALLAKSKAGLDVRIIIRDIGDTRDTLEALRYFGFNMSKVKVQVGCHTKGIIVDSEVVVVGSHNWTGQGTTQNRDASLIFHNAEIAEYYEKVFLYDWHNLSRRKLIVEDAVTFVVNHDETLADDSGESNLIAAPWDQGD
jgi:hypothetical protein